MICDTLKEENKRRKKTNPQKDLKTTVDLVFTRFKAELIT